MVQSSDSQTKKNRKYDTRLCKQLLNFNGNKWKKITKNRKKTMKLFSTFLDYVSPFGARKAQKYAEVKYKQTLFCCQHVCEARVTSARISHKKWQNDRHENCNNIKTKIIYKWKKAGDTWVITRSQDGGLMFFRWISYLGEVHFR